MNSFFETEEMILLLGVAWTNKLVLWPLEWDSFWISVGNWAMPVGDSLVSCEIVDKSELNLDSLKDKGELLASNSKDEDSDSKEIGNLFSVGEDRLDLAEGVSLDEV